MSIPGKILIALLSALAVAAATSALQPQLALLDLLLPSAVASVLAVVLSHRALPVPEALESEAAPAKADAGRGSVDRDRPQKNDKPRDRQRKSGGRDGEGRGREESSRKAPRGAAKTGDFEEGTVKWFNVTKGFGFIIRPNGDEIFVHHRSVLGEGRGRLDDGAGVRFRVVETEKGPQAEDVEAL